MVNIQTDFELIKHINWNVKAAIMPILSSLVASVVDITTTSDAITEDKVGFQSDISLMKAQL